MHYGWGRYVPVAERRRNAMKKLKKLEKKGFKAQPIELEGRTIAKTFWGKAWCDHLESFSDFENRLPRGTRYVRNGSVCHLEISRGKISAKVIGSRLYDVNISIKTLPAKKWEKIKKLCAGQIGSLLELLMGNISNNIMANVTDSKNGLFPLAGEITMSCDCLDWAVMCKHVAATLYGVGARLDEQPELLFVLRGVDHRELITSSDINIATNKGRKSCRRRIDNDNLSNIFGVEVADTKKTKKPKKQKKTKKTSSINPKVTNKQSNTGKINNSRKSLSFYLETLPDDNDKLMNARKKASKKRLESKITISENNFEPLTGKQILKLRKKFKMTVREFAMLIGVSANTIATWSKTTGNIKFQKKSQVAIEKVRNLTKAKAAALLKKNTKSAS